jgi:predicted molibdopterin-dependent oxidoreductase YjgC
MCTMTIDGQIVESRLGQTILEAANAAHIVISTLCYHPDLSKPLKAPQMQRICRAAPFAIGATASSTIA